MHEITAFKSEPQHLSPWLHHPHSLTDKLKAAKGSVDLKVLSQHWVQSTWWDKYALLISSPTLFQRDILMYSEGQAFWFARSIIPKACFELNLDFFNRLKTESIRNLIFESPDVSRVSFKVYSIDERCFEYGWVKPYLPELKGKLWVRAAHYSYKKQELFYLLEILLPALEDLS